MSSQSRISLNGQAEPSATDLDRRKAEVREAMNSRRDRINDLWKAAEDDCREIGYHAAVHCQVAEYGHEHDPNPNLTVKEFLYFLKFPSGWRICYGSTEEDDLGRDTGGDTAQPILDCSVQIRLQMIPHFKKLKQAIIKASEEAVPALDNAIAEFEAELGDNCPL